VSSYLHDFHPVLACPLCRDVLAEWETFSIEDPSGRKDYREIPLSIQHTGWLLTHERHYCDTVELFATTRPLCPACGADLDAGRLERVARWVSTATFWPWTWDSGYWQFREEFQRMWMGPGGFDGKEVSLVVHEGGKEP
jgi:hypothetical protein